MGLLWRIHDIVYHFMIFRLCKRKRKSVNILVTSVLRIWFCCVIYENILDCESIEKYSPCFHVVCTMYDRVYISILDDSAHWFEFVTMLAYAVLLYILRLIFMFRKEIIHVNTFLTCHFFHLFHAYCTWLPQKYIIMI